MWFMRTLLCRRLLLGAVSAVCWLTACVLPCSAQNQTHIVELYDFFYLPIDFKNNCNMGYAFINFVDSIFIVDFFYQYDGTKWTQFNSDKICKITYGRIQGKKALENNFSTMQ